MTREEFQNLMNRVSEAFVDDDDTMGELKRALDEYPEVVEEAAEVGDTVIETGESSIDWRSKYDDLSRRYRERFFTTGEEIKADQREDIQNDGESVTFESLFQRREGDYK